MAKTTNVEQMTPTTNGFTKAYGTAHDSEDDVSNHDDYDDGDDDDGDDDNDDDEDEENFRVKVLEAICSIGIMSTKLDTVPLAA